MRICISIGHSEKEQGATTKERKVTEFVFNTALAQLVKEQLVKQGFDTVITNRLTDGGGTGMTASAKAINATDADVAVELHCNAYNTKAQGCETLYWHSSAKGKKLAQCLQKEMVACLGNPDRGAKALKKGDRGATVLYKTKMPCVITEPFFLDNNEDYQNAFAKIDKLAKAIATGIATYCKEQQN